MGDHGKGEEKEGSNQQKEGRKQQGKTTHRELLEDPSSIWVKRSLCQGSGETISRLGPRGQPGEIGAIRPGGEVGLSLSAAGFFPWFRRSHRVSQPQAS